MFTHYRAGDFVRICDRCGSKCHASNTVKEWSGYLVCRECVDIRNPQDFVRGRADNQTVPDPRPDPGGSFLADNDVTYSDLSPTPSGGSVSVSAPDFLTTNEVTADDL